MVLTLNAHRKKRGFYLVPFKALAEEKYTDFSERYGRPDIGLMIVISDRDHRERDNDIRLGNYDIAILTYEKLLALLTTNPGLIEQCDCVVIDEIQMVLDRDRGATLELLLTAIRRCRRKPQIIGLSAVLGDLNDFDEWLEAKVVHSRERPVELRQGVMSPDGTFEYTEWNSGVDGRESFASGSLQGIVTDLVGRGEQVIVVRHSVAKVAETAFNISAALAGLQPSVKTIQILSDEADTETRDALISCLSHAVAFHHADCELPERRAVEQGFRDGEIRVLVATTTLSAGVNLPCKTVILADNQKWESSPSGGRAQLVNWSIGEVRNIFGRAGRLGLENEYGRGVLLASTQRDYHQVKAVYLVRGLERMRSAIEGRDFRARVLEVVAAGFGGTRNDIADFILSTYAAAKWGTDLVRKQVKGYVEDGIEFCRGHGLLESTPSGEIRATELGSTCAAKGCEIDTFTALMSYVQNAEGYDLLDLAYAASSPPEISDRYYRGVDWADATRLFRLQARLKESADSLTGLIKADAGRLLKASDQRSAFRLLSAFLVKDILERDVTTRALRRAYILSYARVRQFAENLSWMLDTMSAIAKVTNASYVSQMSTAAECLARLTPLECRYLNDIPHLCRDERIRLVKAGYQHEDSFLGAKASDFTGIISPRKAEIIIRNISERRTRDHLYWMRNHRQRLDSLGKVTSLVDSVYTLTGLDLERALDDLFRTGFAGCTVIRLADQREAEPDLLMQFPNGDLFAVQVTARENDRFVDSKKAGDVIPQSARFNPSGYVCLGRPDFQDFESKRATRPGSST